MSTRGRKAPRIATPKPAPGELEKVRAFVSTLGDDDAKDPLATPAGLASWLAQHGLLPAGASLSEDDLKRALAVRQGLYTLLAVHGRDRAKGADDRLQKAVARLAQAVPSAHLRPRFDDAGPSGFEPVGDVADALATLLAITVQARANGHWQRLKVCARNGCRHAFYDTSPNAVGKWCTSRCGDRTRAQTYRKTEWYKSLHRGRWR